MGGPALALPMNPWKKQRRALPKVGEVNLEGPNDFPTLAIDLA